MGEYRWKVACINWSLPDAPKAVAYVLGADGFACGWSDFPTWAEAVAYADHHARTTKNGDAA